MSSIRLFILTALDEHGPLHGHRLRALAQRDRTETWTDVLPGSIYAALKRLANEGLLQIERAEREGNRPERTVYAITDAGREALAVELRDALTKIDSPMDPFDLALARAQKVPTERLEEIVRHRRDSYAQRQAGLQLQARQADPYLNDAERFVLQHLIERAAAEVAWHTRLLENLPTDWTTKEDP